MVKSSSTVELMTRIRPRLRQSLDFHVMTRVMMAPMLQCAHLQKRSPVSSVLQIPIVLVRAVFVLMVQWARSASTVRTET